MTKIKGYKTLFELKVLKEMPYNSSLCRPVYAYSEEQIFSPSSS